MTKNYKDMTQEEIKDLLSEKNGRIVWISERN